MVVGDWRGPGWRVFEADPRCSKEARGWLTRVVSAHKCPVNSDLVAMAAGELFANAVMHGPPGGRVLVGYCLWRRGARIVVCDGGSGGTPRLRESDCLAEGGRGLHVVESLAARWGTFRHEQAQAVWCDFAEPLRVPVADSWAWLRVVLTGLSLDPVRKGKVHTEGDAPRPRSASYLGRTELMPH
jgi:anti-sigma regulatory factor (Ser/Thr protein kinase)